MSETTTETTTIGSLGTNQASLPAPSGKRRRLLRWLALVCVLLFIFIAMLPTIAALPMFRGMLLSMAFPGLNERVAVDRLSLGWFSPVHAGGVRLQGDAGGPPALEIETVDGDTSLWNIITGRQLGEFRIIQPHVFVEFDESGSNWQRLISELKGTPKLDRDVRVAIVDAKVSLQGGSAPQPWRLEKMSTTVSFSPAIANRHGVPLIEGSQLTLLDETELTPELCEDFLKYIVPSLAGVTRTSGKVSLVVDEFSWPVGKPNEAVVKGRLMLHSVDVGPGTITKSLVGRLDSLKLPETLKVVQNDSVTFWIENGRVYHQDFALGIVDLQAEPMIRTQGSVGFDQTLDLTVEGRIPAEKVLPEGVLRDVLTNKTLTFHITGTLENRIVKLQLPADGSLAPAMKVLGELLERRQEKLRENSSRPGILRNRRRAGSDPAPRQ